MAALLEISGMMSGQAFELTKFLGNLRTHLEPKAGFPHPTLQVEENGLASLTTHGHRFFSSRLTDQPVIKGQRVSRGAVIEKIRDIVSAEPKTGWEVVDASLQEEIS